MTVSRANSGTFEQMVRHLERRHHHNQAELHPKQRDEDKTATDTMSQESKVSRE